MSKPAHNDVLKWGYENYLIDNRDFRSGFIEANLADFAEVVYAAGFEAGQKDEREACAAMLDQMAEEAEQDVVELLVKLQERCDALLKQRDELLSALVGYGHKFGCGKNAFGAECTCGIGALIDSVKGGAE